MIASIISSFDTIVANVSGNIAHFEVLYTEGKISEDQLSKIYETCFLDIFIGLEQTIKDIFIAYCVGILPIDGTVVTSRLVNCSNEEAYAIAKGSGRFVSWTESDDIIKKATMLMVRGYPVTDAFVNYKSVFSEYKDLRNHLAHYSVESEQIYVRNLRTKGIPIIPTVPKVGAYLRMIIAGDSVFNKFSDFTKNFIKAMGRG